MADEKRLEVTGSWAGFVGHVNGVIDVCGGAEALSLRQYIQLNIIIASEYLDTHDCEVPRGS